MKNAKFDIAYIDLEGTDLLSSPVIDYGKFYNAFQIRNMVVITNFLIDGVKQPSIPVELEKDDDDYIIFYLTHYKVVIGAEEVTVSEVQTTAELKNTIETTGITNAKPIYCHPVNFRSNFTESNKGARIACLIFNNSPTPFTNETFADYIQSLYDGVGESSRVLATGSYQTDNGHIAIASWIGCSSQGFYLTGVDITDGSAADVSPLTKSQFLERMNNFSDGVNKIN